MKLSAAFNHSFSSGYTYPNQIYDVAKLIPNLNGLYICDPEFLELSKIGTSSNQIQTIYNLLFDGNFLRASNSPPTLVLNDSQFNNYPSIDFNNNGIQSLTFNKQIKVGTVIIVYLTRVIGSYLIASSGVIGGNPPSVYDIFLSGGNSLWSDQALANSSIYNATSRINSRTVSPDVFIPLNNPRILSVTNIDNSNQYEIVNGFGGSAVSGSQSVQGKIAAIITSSSPCPLDILGSVEAKLAEIYIDYKGVVISSQPSFRVFVGEFFSFNFATIAIDEFFDIVNYTFISPVGIGLSFTGSVLSGYLSEVFDGEFTISITNSNSMSSTFSFAIESVKADPFILEFPSQSNISVALSTLKDEDNIPYGIYVDEFNNIVKWEDSRRLPSKPLYISSDTDTINQIIYDGSIAAFITNSSLNPKALSGTGVNCRTFIWVYKQKQSGQRLMANGFPDIFSNGVLWTTSNSEEIFGTTSITKLSTKVNTIPVNTFNYKLPINYGCIVSASSSNDVISFNGFSSQLKGELLFFIGWSTTLNESQTAEAIRILAGKFFNNTLILFSTETDFRYEEEVTIQLDKKVAEILGNPVEYEILVNNYSATILGNNLIFACPTDDFIQFTIRAFTSTESITFSFNVSITLLTNQLYINLKNKLNTFSSFFIVTPESTVISSSTIIQLNEYRTNGQELLGNNNVEYTTSQIIDGLPAAKFNINGSSYLSYNSPNQSTGYCFIIAYIRGEGQSDSAFLFGQDINNIFNSGSNGELLANLFFGDIWANGSFKNIDYVIPEESLSVIIFNSNEEITINSIAKDRLFEDRSVKGLIPLFCIVDYKIDVSLFNTIEKDIRSYYQPPRVVTLLNFDGSITDQSYRNKILFFSSGNIDTVKKKFGVGSYSLCSNGIASYIQIPNDSDFSFLSGDFTIAGWFLIDKATNGEIITLYNQQGLSVFFSGDKFYVGRSNILELAFFNVDLLFSSVTFNHFEIAKELGILRVYLNGSKVYEIQDNYEYRDYNTPIQLGQASVSTANININLDSLVIYRQIALHNSLDYLVPTAPYS